jgi:hypothetical protein
MTKLTVLVLLLCCSACRGPIQLEIQKDQCHSDTIYHTLVFVAETGSGIDAILLGNTYLKPMNEPCLELDFDFTVSDKDSFTIYANGRHLQLKSLHNKHPGAIIKMNGNTLQIEYFCEIPLYQ